MGVWIEIQKRGSLQNRNRVTPFVGVWIEILNLQFCHKIIYVTPFVGVWIEICVWCQGGGILYRHSLRGSVD